jgi:hypothetical protein
MSALCTVLLAGLLPAAAADQPQVIRYLKLAGGKFVLESEVRETGGADGGTYLSRTERPGEKMTLQLRFARPGVLKSAEVVHEKAQVRHSATLTFSDRGAELATYDARITLFLGVKPDVVVTTAPDWSDIFQLARRYERKKGGKQEFRGLWIHPDQRPRKLTFSIERTGKDTIKRRGKTLALERYRIRLRSGDYLAWADEAGQVYKLMVPGKPASAVVREGYQEATAALGR